jgi:hypothetical protein
MSRRGGDSGLFDASIVESAGGTVERDGVASVTLAIGVEKIRSVDFAV